MPCEAFTLPDGTSGFICSRGRQRRARCRFCDRTAPYLCDWPGCDVPICKRHATRAGQDLDVCPPHALLLEPRRLVCGCAGLDAME